MNDSAFELNIRDAIQGLYETFRSYRVEFPLQACECCVTDGDQRRIAAAPLADLSEFDIGRYVYKAVTTFGTVQDFKHFLPRILELQALDPNFRVGGEIVAGKLRCAGWPKWRQDEVDAVDRFLRAFWRHVLETPESTRLIDEALCMVALLAGGLVDYLDCWSTVLDRSAIARVRTGGFIGGLYPVGSPPSFGAFWGPIPDQEEEVFAWLRRSDVVPRIRRSIVEWSQTPDGAKYDYVLDQYENWLQGVEPEPR